MNGFICGVSTVGLMLLSMGLGMALYVLKKRRENHRRIKNAKSHVRKIGA